MKRTIYEQLCLKSYYLKKEQVGTTTCPPYLTIEQAQEAIRIWLEDNKAHFMNQHKYCDDVKKCMDHLLAELPINSSKQTEVKENV